MATAHPALPIAPTEESYAHFLSQHPGLDTLQFVATFCGVKVERVTDWRPSVVNGSFPRGENLLRLRTLLFFAGYQVTELYELRANARALALIVGAGLVDPMPTCKRLGYRSATELHSLWRVLIHSEGFSDEVSKIIDEVVEECREKLQLKQSETADEIGKLADISSTVTENVSASPEPSVDPAIVAATSRTVATALALGRVVLDNNGRSELLSQTRGGTDLRELIELLQHIVGD